MDGNRNRPAEEPGGSKVATTTDDLTRHGALIAESATMPLPRLDWEQGIDLAVADGHLFSVDDLQARYGLPDLGNGLGGLLMRLHRAGVIARVGYKPSRAGGVVAVWGPGDRR
jgi:hypothetical protein